MATTETNDAINRERWLQCIVSHNAAVDYFNVLRSQGYFSKN